VLAGEHRVRSGGSPFISPAGHPAFPETEFLGTPFRNVKELILIIFKNKNTMNEYK